MATCPTCRTHYPNAVKVCATDGEALLPDEAFSNADADLEVGQKVGEYEVEAKIGEGGFGSVYRAVHPLIGKAAAIKVLNRQYSSSPQMVSRFIAEARAVNQIKNRGIVDIFSFGKLDDGRQYYVMELLSGVTLDKHVHGLGRLPPDEVIRTLRGVARALDAAHAAGIAHRDLKPENIILVFDEDGAVFPKLLDFGIAKLLGDSPMSGHKTRTGTPMGTPHYMSPEQCRGKNVDHRTDIYSFGILVHEALTGQLPFDGEEVIDLLLKHTTARPPRVSEVCPDLPAALDAPVLHMLEKDPDMRPASVVAALDALAVAAHGAGFAVELPSVRRAGDRGAAIGDTQAGSQVRVTPGSAEGLAQARTVVNLGTDKTLGPAEADARPVGGRRPGVYVGVGVAFAVAILAAVLVMRPTQNPPTLAANASALVPQSATKPVVPTVTPSPSAEILPDDVEITLQPAPKVVADVYRGAEKLGTSAAPVHLKRGAGTSRLTLKAPGFVPADLDVSDSSSTTVVVKLTPLPAAPAAAKKPGKPEVEF